jgi:hypothetical protein
VPLEKEVSAVHYSSPFGSTCPGLELASALSASNVSSWSLRSPLLESSSLSCLPFIIHTAHVRDHSQHYKYPPNLQYGRPSGKLYRDEGRRGCHRRALPDGILSQTRPPPLQMPELLRVGSSISYVTKPQLTEPQYILPRPSYRNRPPMSQRGRMGNPQTPRTRPNLYGPRPPPRRTKMRRTRMQIPHIQILDHGRALHDLQSTILPQTPHARRT